MAASSIKSDLGKFLVNLALHKVENWASKEFNNLRNSNNFPVCVQLTNNSWCVGPYEIKNLGSNKWEVSKDYTNIHTFYSKQAAMFYAVFERLQYYKIAAKILHEDQKVAKVATEIEIYSNKLKKNTVIKDIFKFQLYTSRLLEAQSMFSLYKSELEKTLILAKYYKIWDRIL
jgi:hypothetical protein